MRRRSLSRPDEYIDPIRRRRERADPLWVVRARRVVGEVEIEDEAFALHPEVRAFPGVEEIPAGSIGLRSTRRVAERDEHAADVALEPVELERRGNPADLETRLREPRESVGALAARLDLVVLGLPVEDLREHAERRIVVEEGKAGERLALRLGDRRLGMTAEEVVPDGAPALPRAGGFRRRADLLVQPRHAPSPVG